MLRKRALLVILSLLLTLLLGNSAAAQGEVEIAWSAEALLGGVFKYGEWLPVRITLANDGPDREVEVRATIPLGDARATYARRIELPRGARKQVTLYVRPSSFSRRVVLVLHEDGREPAQRAVAIQRRSAWDYLVGVVAGHPDGLADLAAVRMEGPGGKLERVSFPVEEIPDRAAGLRSLDALVLNDVDTGQLTPAQQQALIGWVQQGGRLIIGGGVGAAQTLAGLPETLRPVRLLGTRTVDTLHGLAPLGEGIPIRVPGPFDMAEAEPVDAEVLAERAGVPLVVRRRLGAGAVIFVALDLSRSPFGEWAGAPAFWKTLLEPDRAVRFEGPPDMSPLDFEAGPMLSALTNLPTLELPSVRWVALLLLFYILLVGPLNYLVLRRWRRLEWAWITIPLLTVAFSGLSYGIGYGLRGGEVILNQLSIIQFTPDHPMAHVRTYVGLFSPTRRAYNLRVAEDMLAGPLSSRYGGPWGPPRGSATLTAIQGNPTLVRDLTVNQWSMQSFMAEGMVEVPIGLEAELWSEDRRLVGRVTNSGPRVLDDVVVVMGGDFARLGAIAPGESKAVELRVTVTGDRARPPISYRLFREAFQRPGPLHRELRMKQQMLEAALDAPWKGALFSPSGPLVLAWTDTSPVQVTVEGAQARRVGLSLIVAHVPLRFGERRVGVPPGVIPARLVKQQGTTGMCHGSPGTGYELDNGTVVLEFDLPPELEDVQVERLELVLASNGGWGPPPDTALYDWSAQEWVELEEVQLGANPVPDPHRFVDPTRRTVRVRLSATGIRGGCLYVDLGVEGRRSTTANRENSELRSTQHATRAYGSD
jgi:hypothetical protein